MFELKISSAEFLNKAIRAGKEAYFEGAIVILLRGINDVLEKELIERWSDIDDITHNDILILSYGFHINHSGITAYNIQRNVIADGISVEYPYSGNFNEKFENLLNVAYHRPNFSIDTNTKFNSHGTTEIRRSLNIKEEQLPALLAICYKQNIEYLIELSDGRDQLSPSVLISEISRNLDDKPYRYNKLSEKNSKMYEKTWQLESKINSKKSYLKKFSSGPFLSQLDSLIRHIKIGLKNAPDEIQSIGKNLIDHLNSDSKQKSDVLSWINELIKYDNSINYGTSKSKLVKKLEKAHRKIISGEPFSIHNGMTDLNFSKEEIETLNLEISNLEHQLSTHEAERKLLKDKMYSIDRFEAFKHAIESTISDLNLTIIQSDDLEKSENIDRIVVKPQKSDDNISQYDVALSFAGEDRDYVDKLANILLENGVKIFYDKYERSRLWGKNLYEYLDEIYRIRAKFCLMFVSENYSKKLWTNHERKSAQARAFQENNEYILPIRFDNTSIPGLLDTTAYIDANEVEPEKLSNLVIEKLRNYNSS